MKRINILALLLVLSVLVMPALGAENNTRKELLRPGMGSEWLSSQDTETQKVVDYLLAALVVATAIAFLFYLSRGGVTIMKESTEMGDPQKKSSAGTGIIMVLVALVVIVLLYRIGMSFFGYY